MPVHGTEAEKREKENSDPFLGYRSEVQKVAILILHNGISDTCGLLIQTHIAVDEEQVQLVAQLITQQPYGILLSRRNNLHMHGQRKFGSIYCFSGSLSVILSQVVPKEFAVRMVN